MKVLSGMFLLLWLLASPAVTWASNTVVLGDDGEVTEEQTDTETAKDKKATKDKEGTKDDSEEEEPDCE